MRSDVSGDSGVVFLSWGRADARGKEIAAELGGLAWSYRPKRLDRKAFAPVRWLLGAVATTRFLASKRPRALIATNPPIWLGLICWLYCRQTGARLVLDSHPGGFGPPEQGDPVSSRVQRLHAWLARRSEAVLVTCDPWRERVESWGGTGIVLHEAPSRMHIAYQQGPAQLPLNVLCICVFAPDEPIGPLLEAVRGLDAVRLLVTGDRRRGAQYLEDAPPQAEFVGYLDEQDYERAFEQADLVVTLTTDPTSVMRSAAEAVWTNRPLLISDTKVLAETFPYALRSANSAPELRAALITATEELSLLRARTVDARGLQMARWLDQKTQLRKVLGLNGLP